MMRALHHSHRHHLVRAATLVVLGCAWMSGCATKTSELKQEIEVLLKQTVDQVRQETNRMDTEIAQIRSEVVQLRSDVGRVDSRVGRLKSDVRQLGSEVNLLQTDVQKNDTSLVDLAVRVNQLDRRVAKSDKSASPNGEHTSRPSEIAGAQPNSPVAAAAVPSERAEPAGAQPNPPVAAAAVSSERAEPVKGLKQGMSQQDVLRLLGNPHEIERVLDSVYWYYGDGELQGGYVRFDATSGQVNGWSTVSPQHFQLDLRTTQGGYVR
jgi:septal ring factor EnvC (AmiA/AmiB activator)